MSGKTAIRVSEEVMKEIIHPYAALRGYDIDTAVDRLLHIGWSRHKALASYAGPPKVKEPKAPKEPKAKKEPKAPKAPKAAKKGKKPKVSKKVAKAPKTSKKSGKKLPFVVAPGEANAPAPVADQELDDNFDAVLKYDPEPAPPAPSGGFDPFETYDADAPEL